MALPLPPPPEPSPPSPGPVPAGQRVDTLDVLRGFTLLGILLVNIELFRGADLYALMAGEAPELTRGEEAVQFLVGWLVGGKFLSSFALLFGVGAAIMAGRASTSGVPVRRLLARRYGWLLVFGLAHMFLLFSGDILFIYGLAGLLLLPFVFMPARTMLWWAGGLVAGYLVITLGFTAIAVVFETVTPDMATDDPFTTEFEAFFAERREAAVAAYTEGGLGDQLRARAWEALFIQGGQLFVVPWVLAIFLLGFAVGKAGVVADLAGHRRLLRRAALVGLGGGVILNLPLGFAGTLGAAAIGPDAQVSGLLLLALPVAQLAGAPLLAVGYLATLALWSERPAVRNKLRLLRDAGRMALSGYVLQSILAVIVFAGLGLYDALTSVEALVVVVVIWLVMLTFCSVWQRFLGRGPLERLWRRLTYGRPDPPTAGSR